MALDNGVELGRPLAQVSDLGRIRVDGDRFHAE
jgi:hypothetical protein